MQRQVVDVPVPVVAQRQLPTIQSVQIVDVPKIQYTGKTVDVPVVLQRSVEAVARQPVLMDAEASSQAQFFD